MRSCSRFGILLGRGRTVDRECITSRFYLITLSPHPLPDGLTTHMNGLARQLTKRHIKVRILSPLLHGEINSGEDVDRLADFPLSAKTCARVIAAFTNEQIEKLSSTGKGKMEFLEIG